MKDQAFKKMDAALMKATEKYRSAEASETRPSGFSDDVLQNIRDRQSQKSPSPAFGLRLALPVFAPVFAVLVLGVYLVLRDPGVPNPLLREGAVQLAFNTATNVDEEIAVLKAIGAWTEEDEVAAGVAGDWSDDVEISSTQSSQARHLAVT